ncbi:MAG: Rrf2 family transcriptional regulator [Pirellulales bacterium]|nr:Rrf2 family transcriptional regulator [Pirellulales bacterium]
MLPKTAEYALRTIVWLALHPHDSEPADRVAKGTKVPRRYLHKVLQELARAKLVRSQSGPGGGYSLAKSPEAITILDVVNSVAPMERIHKCPLGLRSHTQLCPLHQELDKVYVASERALARVVIAKLLRSTNPIVPLCEVKPTLRPTKRKEKNHECVFDSRNGRGSCGATTGAGASVRSRAH